MNIIFYKNSNGKEPVKYFIDNLSKDNKKILSAKILTVSKLFTNNIISQELFKKVSDDIWEIRFKNIRVFVFIKDCNMYLLHAIIKKKRRHTKKRFKFSHKKS